MSSDKKLSKTQKINQNKIFKDNDDAQKGQDTLEKAVLSVRGLLTKHYDSSFIQFKWAKELPQSAIAQVTKKYYGKNHDYVEGENPCIKPDGGIVFCELQNQKLMDMHTLPLFCSEYKKQGVDKDQAKGNAIERAYKNLQEYNLYTLFQPFSSYYIFCSGSDFVEGSSIRDRLTGATLKRPFNTSYYEKIKGDASASVYLKTETWSCDEMTNIMFEDSKKIIDSYIMNLDIKEQGIIFK
jgi:type II restriction enzyme